MKKLMFVAAAVAATSVAFGKSSSACGEADQIDVPSSVCGDVVDIGTLVEDGCQVWDLTLKLKTLAPKKVTCKVCSSGCSDKFTLTYLDAASRTFTGYMWICDDLCDTINNDGPYVVLWEKSSKTPVIPLKYYLNAAQTAWAQDPCKLSDYGATSEPWVLYRYGKKALNVGAWWDIDIESYYDPCKGLIYAAGFGKGDKNKYLYDGDAPDDSTKCYGVIIKSISGNVVAKWPISSYTIRNCWGTYSYDIVKVELCDCFENWCDLYDITGNTWDDGDQIAAYGTWSMKYNKKVSKAKTSMLKLVPSYALVEE